MVERVLIVGGGIAGLAAAIALRQHGLVPEIIEQGDTWASSGAGLYLVGNGTRALQALGLADSLARTGAVIRTQSFLSHRGVQLAQIDVEAFWAECGPCLGLLHSDLHRLLVQQIVDLPCRFGITVQALQQYAGHVAVGFSDGSFDSYDFVIGADGMRSSIRRLEFGDGKLRFRDQVSWRFITQLPAGVSGWTVFLGAGRTFLLLPIGNNMVYCYGDRSSARPIRASLDEPVEQLRTLFDDFASPVPEVLAHLRSSEPIYYAPIEEVVHEPWGRGRVVLIGDAAHAMSPNMACGAALAVEDALVLADSISHAGAVSQIVPEFIRRRTARISWVRKQTERRDRTRNLPPAIRDSFLRVLGDRLYRANYQPLLTSI